MGTHCVQGQVALPIVVGQFPEEKIAYFLTHNCILSYNSKDNQKPVHGDGGNKYKHVGAGGRVGTTRDLIFQQTSASFHKGFPETALHVLKVLLKIF